MSKKKNAELSRMWGFAGKRHWLTIASCILAGISTVLSIIPFVCIWFVIRDILYAMKKGDLSLAASSGHYAWLAVAFSLLSILLYFVALCCSHLAAFRTATNMKKRQCTILSRYRLDISVRMPVADFGKLLMTMLD